MRNGSFIYIIGLEMPTNMQLLITRHLMIQRTINKVAVNFEKYVLVLLKCAKQLGTTNSIVRLKHSNVLPRNG